MASSRKKKNRSARPRTALVLSALVVAGGVATAAWFQFRGLKKNAVANPLAVAATNTASTASQTNQPDVSAFVAWLSNRTDAAELLNIGTSLLDEGRTGQAILCYRRAVELKPEDEEGHFDLGVAYGRLGQLPLAERHYREALKIFSDYPEAHNNLGNVLTRQRRYAEAIEEFQTALKLSPESASTHNNLGRALAEQGNAAEALAHFRQAARLDTNYVEAHFNLASAYLGVGRTNEAIAELNTALRIRPDFAPALQLLPRLQTRPR